MKSLDKLFKFGVGALIGVALIGGYGCTNSDNSSKVAAHPISQPSPNPSPQPSDNYKLVFHSDKVLGSGYDKPEGLKLNSPNLKSQNYVYSKMSVDSTDVVTSVFLERPDLTNFSNPDLEIIEAKRENNK